MTWKKGQSGNPRGRQLEKAQLPDPNTLQQLGTRALAVIAELMESADKRTRLDAAKYIADRAFGKAPQSMELTGKEGGPLIAVIRDG